MGGTALERFNIVTRRLDKEEFLTLENEVIEKLSKYFLNGIYKIPYYREKKTFGDLDLVVIHI